MQGVVFSIIEKLVFAIKNLRLWISSKINRPPESSASTWTTFCFVVLITTAVSTLADIILSAIFGTWGGKLSFLIDITVALVLVRTLFP